MSNKTTSNRLIVPSFDWHAGFYQQLIGSISGFQELGKRVVKITEHARVFRSYETVNEGARILINLPSKEYQAIGHYYLGWCEFMNRGDAKASLERAAEYAPARYRALAMYSLAAIEARKQNHEAELSWFLESTKVYPSIDVIRGIAVIKAKEGYHRSALKVLERLSPLLRYAEPFVYYDILNSLAVELGEVGRKYEARNVIKHVLESPFIIAYPEWRETGNDLRGANRSFVVIDPSPLKPRNVLSMPTPERDEIEFPAWAGQPAPVLSYQKWTQRMAKKKKNGNKPVEQMTESEMMMEIMNLYTSDKTTNADRRRMYVAMMKAFFEPDKPDTPENPDDETPGA